MHATTKRVREFPCENEKTPCKWFNMDPLRIGMQSQVTHQKEIPLF
jgi:hypothetical protein